MQNKDDVEDDLPEYKDNFSGWFSEQLKAEFAEQTGITPSIVEQKSDDAFDMTVTKLGKKEYKVPNPKFDAIGVGEGFVVSIAFLDISRLSETRMIVPQLRNQELFAVPRPVYDCGCGWQEGRDERYVQGSRDSRLRSSEG